MGDNMRISIELNEANEAIFDVLNKYERRMICNLSIAYFCASEKGREMLISLGHDLDKMSEPSEKKGKPVKAVVVKTVSVKPAPEKKDDKDELVLVSRSALKTAGVDGIFAGIDVS